ncbi:hypothetical protein [Algoriphagus boritolerans]|uniref:hypothetical protein n=1 Tax=Algoriphagus boritolerans TaxID=308111 RepID=UPI002FCE10A2
MNPLILDYVFKKIKCNMALESVQSSLKEEELIGLRFLPVNFFYHFAGKAELSTRKHGI